MCLVETKLKTKDSNKKEKYNKKKDTIDDNKQRKN